MGFGLRPPRAGLRRTLPGALAAVRSVSPVSSVVPKDDSTRFRRAVAIDESLVKIGERNAYFWLARDIDSGEIVSFRCSFTASPEDSADFCLSILRRCQERPAVRLGKGANYPKGLKNPDLQFEVETPPSPGITQMLRRFFLSGRI